MSRTMFFLTGLVILKISWAPDRGRCEETLAGPTTWQTTTCNGECIRFATYNVSLYRESSGQLLRELRDGRCQPACDIAEVIQRTRPDVLLLNEFDYDPSGRAAALFSQCYLERSQRGCRPIRYAHRFLAPVNTGVPTGLDLDKDGRSDLPGDAIGYGQYPGQYGMLVLSRFPIATEGVRTFRRFLWRDMPGARLPRDPATNELFYSARMLKVLRLSSKSHWDLPIDVGPTSGCRTRIHLLASHPTPPVFDGPENRNGCRNHDEIRLWRDYIDPRKSLYLVDDAGRRGGLPANALFVVAGDLNADPADGDPLSAEAIQGLLVSKQLGIDPRPRSDGAVAAAASNPSDNRDHQGLPQLDTAAFGQGGPGNLRVDYVLPSAELVVVRSGVFWPVEGEPGAMAVRASDHRLVWVDVLRKRLARGVEP